MTSAVPVADRDARRERRRLRTRVAILDAAEPVFQQAGFHGARVEQIADAADVSVGTVYSYFPGKHGVYLALVERALDLFGQYMDLGDDPALSPLQRVLVAGDAYLRFHVDHPGYFHFFAHGLSLSVESGAADSEEVERICRRVTTLLDNFAAEIDQAIAAGEAIPVDSRALTRFTWGAWNGVISLSRQPPPLALTDDQIAQTLELGRWILRQALASPQLRDAEGNVNLPLPHVDERHSGASGT